MSNLHGLEEYQLAKDVCKQLPQVRQMLIVMQNSLEPFLHFKEVGMVHTQMAESLIIIDIHLDKYEKILEEKGKL